MGTFLANRQESLSVKSVARHPYTQPLDLPFKLPTKMYTGMLVVWLLRPALQKKFPLHSGKSDVYLKFLAWCVGYGRREYSLLRNMPEWDEELSQKLELPALPGDRWAGVYTVGMYLAAICRSKFWVGQVVNNAAMRHRSARWYFREGRSQIGLSEVCSWQVNALLKNFESAQDFLKAISVTNDQQCKEATSKLESLNKDILSAWSSKLDKKDQQVISLYSVPQKRVSGFIAGISPVDVNELAVLQHLKNKPPKVSEITKVVQQLNTSSTPSSNQAVEPVIEKQWPFGVNLYGYARGELGIGEDVRMLAIALQAADIPICILNIELGANISQSDQSAEHLIAAAPRYSISIFCMTGIEMSRLVCEKGLGVLKGRYNIGLWPWELPVWPKAWQHSWSLVNEIWGISQFATNSYRQAPLPVKCMPLPVVVQEVTNKSRADWGLPEHTYLFIFAFDMNSTIARKNPEAVITAFKLAFKQKKSADNVGLVIKVSHAKEHDAQWKRLKRLISHDPRIHLITSEMRRSDVLSLYQNCNCYVSLHRSEGFGRGIAEAQLLGLDLIVTGYSGNMDFCKDNQTLLVDYQLLALKEGEYFFGDGQCWANPDTQHAAEQMKACVARAQKKREKNIQYETNRFSADYCGAMYKNRLCEIAEEFRLI